MPERKLVIGTRPSALALWQARFVLERLEQAARRLGLPFGFTLKEIRTEGDLDHTTPLAAFGQRGVFVRAVEQALRRGEVDIAVHSLKDLPVEQPDDLVLAAYPVRDDARDALVLAAPGAGRGEPEAPCPGTMACGPASYSSAAEPLERLPRGARLGTGSPRRIAHLRHWRPDLEFVPIRGNVDTRLRKLKDDGLDAVVLAAAGLRRLGLWDDRMVPLGPEVCLPAPGQGALAVEVRKDDEAALDAVRLIDDVRVRLAVAAERALLLRLGGGCHVPVGALAEWSEQAGEWRIALSASVASPDGQRLLMAHENRRFGAAPVLVQAGQEDRRGVADPDLIASAESEARELAEDAAAALLAQGAGELLAAGT